MYLAIQLSSCKIVNKLTYLLTYLLTSYSEKLYISVITVSGNAPIQHRCGSNRYSVVEVDTPHWNCELHVRDECQL